MVIQSINGINYKLREKQDFSWLSEFGKVFSVIDETGSGCICFGIEKDSHSYFFKIAGANTVESEVSNKESIELLKKAVVLYEELRHPSLINLIKHFAYKEFYIAVFDYAFGECLFDHWNFEYYKQNNIIDTPIYRFKKLSIETRLKVVDDLFSFYKLVIQKGYVPVDFYDSSIIYDFDNNKATFCDIDLFAKMPTYNDRGTDYFGTKRLKAPEENIEGEIIDERTAIFNLGAIISDMFSKVTNTKQRRELGGFIQNDFVDFELNKQVYDCLNKATNYDRTLRFNTITEFESEFKSNLALNI